MLFRSNQAAYQAYIDANPSLFSSPATAAEVQAMITAVNAAEAVGTISSLDCGSALRTGTLVDVEAASGVSYSVPYPNGNGGKHTGQTVTSTGITGLTATLSAGNFAIGAGSLVYTITGTPSASGLASFALDIGGQTCELIVTVIGKVTGLAGLIWLDQNLGSTQVATSSTDANSYGDLYQWGRVEDGHQLRTSNPTPTLAASSTPGNSDFITSGSDWLGTPDDNLWQGISGVNNPCPSGYRIPTDTELDDERVLFSSQDAAGALASPLKLPLTGSHGYNTGAINNVGSNGYYWTSTVSSSNARYLVIGSTNANLLSYYRGSGFAVRCLKVNAASAAVLAQIGLEADSPDTVNSVVTFAELNTILPALTGLLSANEAAYQDYIDANPGSFASPATAAEIQAMVTAVNAAVALTCPIPNASGTLTFLCHNLGADTSLDPHTPVVGLNGAYIQWGKRGPNTTGNSVEDWQTAGNTSSFAAAPTAANANSGAISGWSTSPAANGSWGSTKTANDPCPTGYRVPRQTEWEDVNNNNTATRTGLPWSVSPTNYGAALHFGTIASPKLLTLPAAGARNRTDGTLLIRGSGGYYWSSTENVTNSVPVYFDNISVNPANGYDRTYGFSLRCISE